MFEPLKFYCMCKIICTKIKINNGRVVSLFRAALTSAERHSNSLRQSKYLMAVINIASWQRHIALAVGADGGCLDIFSRPSFLFSFSLSGRRPDID